MAGTLPGKELEPRIGRKAVNDEVQRKKKADQEAVVNQHNQKKRPSFPVRLGRPTQPHQMGLPGLKLRPKQKPVSFYH